MNPRTKTLLSRKDAFETREISLVEARTVADVGPMKFPITTYLVIQNNGGRYLCSYHQFIHPAIEEFSNLSNAL